MGLLYDCADRRAGSQSCKEEEDSVIFAAFIELWNEVCNRIH
jgi:hypothetical protein